MIKAPAPNRQSGWTLWGLVGVMALVGFFALLFLKLFPPYLDNFRVKQALETVASEAGAANATKRQLIQRLDRLLYVDYADDVVDLKKALYLEKERNSTTIIIQYEVIVPLVYNLSALIEFDNRATAYPSRL